MPFSRRVFAYLLMCLGLCAAGVAQTPTPLPLTGNLAQISGTPQGYSGVSIALENCPAPVTITGYSVIVQTALLLQANSTGLINSTIWGNDQITCNGSTGNSQYSITYLNNGTPANTPYCVQFVSSQGVANLNTQQPIACMQTPPNPQDATYRNLTVTGFFQGNNGAFSGTLSVGGLLTANGGIQLPSAQPCTSGFMTGLNANLSPQCNALPVTGVVSFNGRAGAVTSANGDYSYGQISGTPAPLVFSGRFATTFPNVDLANSGVTAGTYKFPTVTVDAFGRVTNIANGSFGLYQKIIITSGICTADPPSYSTCTMGAVSWPTPFTGTYSLVCQGFGPTNGSGPTGSISGGIYDASKALGSITISLQTVTSSGFSYTEIDCTGVQ